LLPLFFYVIIRRTYHKYMDRERLKLIVRNLKSLTDALESEVYSNVELYVHPWDEHVNKTEPRVLTSEDDDDGYPD